jgi:hypothetical protein
MSIPENYYKSMFNYYNGREINGMQVDKDNFAEFVRKNPKHVSSFLNLFNQKLAAKTPSNEPVVDEDGIEWIN